MVVAPPGPSSNQGFGSSPKIDDDALTKRRDALIKQCVQGFQDMEDARLLGAAITDIAAVHGLDSQYEKAILAWTGFLRLASSHASGLGADAAVELNRSSFSARSHDYDANPKDTVIKSQGEVNGMIVDTLEAVANRSGKLEPVSVLDVGCANGKRTMDFVEMARWRKMGVDVRGLDISADMARLAEERGVSEVRVGDMRDLVGLFGTESMDMVTSLTGTLGHLRTAADREEAVRASWDVLKPGGALFYEVFNQVGYFNALSDKQHNVASALKPLIDKYNLGEFTRGDQVYFVGAGGEACSMRHFRKDDSSDELGDLVAKACSVDKSKVESHTVGYGVYKDVYYGGKVDDGFNRGMVTAAVRKPEQYALSV